MIVFYVQFICFQNVKHLDLGYLHFRKHGNINCILVLFIVVYDEPRPPLSSRVLSRTRSSAAQHTASATSSPFLTVPILDAVLCRLSSLLLPIRTWRSCESPFVPMLLAAVNGLLVIALQVHARTQVQQPVSHHGMHDTSYAFIQQKWGSEFAGSCCS
jgi:hypothetical protein